MSAVKQRDDYCLRAGSAEALASPGNCSEGSCHRIQSVIGCEQQPGGQGGFPKIPFLLVFLPICVSSKHNPLILLEIVINYLMRANKSLPVPMHEN